MNDDPAKSVHAFPSKDLETGENVIVVVELDAMARFSAKPLRHPIGDPYLGNPPPEPPIWSRFLSPVCFGVHDRNHQIAASKSFDDMTNNAAEVMGMTREDFNDASALLGHESPQHHAAKIWIEIGAKLREGKQ